MQAEGTAFPKAQRWESSVSGHQLPAVNEQVRVRDLNGWPFAVLAIGFLQSRVILEALLLLLPLDACWEPFPTCRWGREAQRGQGLPPLGATEERGQD